ncbi:hypothetical protein SCAR479_03526 [Seiridium cardinale]|uniref:Uncharacterized protein n=1 Tax=Seiridium cardinale TaxID=138064 RepID=A0ABR2Y084_9PEZI
MPSEQSAGVLALEKARAGPRPFFGGSSTTSR